MSSRRLLSAALADVPLGLAAAARRVGRWWPAAGSLPAQVIHGDLAPSNVLADPDTGEMTGLLDFELTGAGFWVQDTLATLVRRDRRERGLLTLQTAARGDSAGVGR